MTAFDGRRRRYVPLDVTVAFGRFGTRLNDKWGMEGLCTWMLFLAACKREPVEGTFTYTTDDEAWGKLGARTKAFTIDEFFKVCGQSKKTSRRRHGRVSYVTCTVWADWNRRAGDPPKPPRTPPEDPPETFGRPLGDLSETSRRPLGDDVKTSRTPHAAAQNTSTEPQNTGEIQTEYERNAEKCDGDTTPEVEVEVDLDSDQALNQELKPPDQELDLDPHRTGLENGKPLETLEQLAERLTAQTAPRGSEGRLFEVIHDMDAGSPAVIRALLDKLPARTIEEVREEIIHNQPRSPVKYAVGILTKRVDQRQGHTGAAT